MKQRRSTAPREIAWRLLSGDSRLPVFLSLPEDIREGLRAIAHMENKSPAWVIERIIIETFGLRQPKYRQPKRLQGLNGQGKQKGKA
jgi:hypothetical protein